MNCTAVILAGGKSLRFGSDKTRLEINRVRIIELIVEKCRAIFSEIIIVGAGFNIPGTRQVADIFRNMGPLGGIHAGLSASSNETCFITACDMPNFYSPLVKKLLDFSDGYDVVIPQIGEHVQPLFAVYKKSVLPEVERLLSQNICSVLRLYDTVRVCRVEVVANKNSIGRPESDIFFNINYREEYEMFNEAIPPVLSVVGFSDSGKTTYLEKLIPALKKRGLKLGVIKHDAHSFEIDVPGKDSWRLTQAGADITVISSPAKIAIMEKREQEENLTELARRLKGKVDLVLTESYKRDKALKIEIRRAAKSREPFCEDTELFAVAGDYTTESETPSKIPHMPLDDAELMADLIVKSLESGELKGIGRA